MIARISKHYIDSGLGIFILENFIEETNLAKLPPNSLPHSSTQSSPQLPTHSSPHLSLPTLPKLKSQSSNFLDGSSLASRPQLLNFYKKLFQQIFFNNIFFRILSLFFSSPGGEFLKKIFKFSANQPSHKIHCIGCVKFVSCFLRGNF